MRLPHDDDARADEGRSGWILAWIACAAGALAFANTLGHQLTYDDSTIATNALLQEPWNLRALLTSPYHGAERVDSELYRPLASWSLALNWALNRAFGLAGEHPFVYHATNVLLHAATCLMLVRVLLSLHLPRLVIAACALWFATHPIHCEAVANVTNRSEMLAALLGSSAWRLQRAGRGVWAGVCFGLAMCSKESALGFALIMPVAERLFPSASPRLRWSAYVPTAVAIVLFFAARASVLADSLERPALIENPLIGASLLERIPTACAVQLRYLGLLVWPSGFSSDYSFAQIPLVRSFASAAVLGFLAVVLAACALAWKLRARAPELALALFGYAVLFAPTSNFLLAIGAIMGERFAYGPSNFFCLFAAAGLRAVSRPRPAWIGIVAVSALLCVLTWRQNRVWRDDATLFREQVATAPKSAKAHLNYGIVLQLAGDNAQARGEFEQSLRIFPEHAHTWYCLGIVLYNLRAEPKLIIETFQRALSLAPMHHDARAKLAHAFAAFGMREQALAAATELERLAPNHPALPALAQKLGLVPPR
jgi:protein O-mannosyl-transferase